MKRRIQIGQKVKSKRTKEMQRMRRGGREGGSS